MINFWGCVGDGWAEFAVSAVDRRPDIASWSEIRRAAAEILHKCDRGYGVHWGGVVQDLGKW